MKNIFIMLSMGVILVTTSCHKKDKKLQILDKDLRTVLTKDQLDTAKFCIIVPRTGCGGCIDNATAFVRINLPNVTNTEVIFTGIIDKKLLSLEVGEEILKRKNVHLDTNNVFRDLAIASIYPQLIKMKDGNSIEIKDLDVNSSDMEQILKK